ncbi:unnamed protein product [Zymoseptoria tritici ST99CH_3D7]|uniref:SET domain-containing protein n=1 Tax=Zymoseptoria tritici (strain ST99CH_3D7) TaxID=1276538 RepID=A0A1X7S4D0_ZYMT9|nr:unnamed protein product [Zymoseptoria tritici ST99CH_3D7]
MASAENGNVIHMTQEESDRMRETVQNRLRKCQELKGQAREKRDRKDAISFATQSSLMADMAGQIEPGMSVSSRPDAMVALAVGNPFPPSTTKLDDLKPMLISELQIDTHHQGRVLDVKRCAAVVELVAYSWTIVEDKAGDVERIEIYLHKFKRGEEALDCGPNFRIKEPYFTINEQGEPTIRIHHPSDLVRLDTDPVPKTAQKCKDLGNAALKRKEYFDSIRRYTQGLELCGKDGGEDIRHDIYRNRAHVNLLLNRFDEAKADGLASVTGGGDEKSRLLDSKAQYRAGCAAYSLGQFEDAQRPFKAAQELAPEDKDTNTFLRNIDARLREQVSGDYNFTKIRLKLSKARPRVDAATFVGNVEVRDSPLGGRGVFATKEISAGELILCEKAFCVAWGHEEESWTAMTYDARDDRIRAYPAGLTKVIVQKLLNNPSQIEKVMDLFGDWRSIGKEVVIGEDGPVVEAFQVHDVVCRNAFGPGAVVAGEAENIRKASTGLWLMAAYINHSCLPNAEKSFLGDLMVVRATRNITAGSEITHSYDSSSDYDARQEALMKTWGFRCRCELCKADGGDAAEVRKKRRNLEQQALAVVAKEHPSSARRTTVLKVERLAKLINETYDDERYKDLPRMALAQIEAWLGQAVRR